MAFAQVHDDPTPWNGTLGGLVPETDSIGPVGIINELYEAHANVTGIMITYSETVLNEGFVDDELYLEAAYVDEENERLVVWLNPVHLLNGPIDTDDLYEELEISVPVQIEYGFFMDESGGSTCPAGTTPLQCYYWDRYVGECVPAATRNHCGQFKALLEGWGYAPPASSGPAPPVDTDGDGINDDVDQCDTQAENYNGYQDSDGCPDTVPVPAPAPAPEPVEGVLFQDGFENGLGKWLEAGQLEWRHGQLDEYALIPGHTSSNVVAEADDCDDRACILYMREPLDLSPYGGATLEFDRFVDDNLDYGEYLAVEVGNGGSYDEVLRWTHGDGDDNAWHRETVDLSDYLGAGFNVRFVTEQSSYTEEVAVDNVRISVEDVEDCVLVIRAELLDDGTIGAEWNDCGESIRKYKMYTSEDGGFRKYRGSIYEGTSYAFADPQEGHSYEILVRAQYTEARDYGYTEYFRSNPVHVPVQDRTPPAVSVPDDIAVNATGASGAVVTYHASAHDAVDSVVGVTCSPASGAVFAVGTTDVACTATDSAGNAATATFRVVVAEYVPDADGDGFADAVDPCPSEYGLENGGCPEPAPAPQTNQTRAECEQSKGEESGDWPCLRDIFPPPDRDVYYGGDRYYRFMLDTSYLYRTTGTVTIKAEQKDGTVGLVTSGHVVRVNSDHLTLDRHGLGSENQSGNDLGHDFTIGLNGGSVDAAFIPLSDGDPAMLPGILTHTGDVIDVIGGNLDDAGSGETITMYGVHNNDGGAIIAKNATIISISHNGTITTMTGMGIGTYDSQNGDSGAPILYRDGDERKLVGVHKGSSCSFSSPSEGIPLYDRTSCDLGITERKSFSHWDLVRDALNLK